MKPAKRKTAPRCAVAGTKDAGRKMLKGSALPRLETRVAFVGHVNAATAADGTAISVTQFRRLQGVFYLHEPNPDLPTKAGRPRSGK
tara:strand:- start:308 stop:568 length:261 start_codon:yes stop_codon:yes gene_type:complete